MPTTYTFRPMAAIDPNTNTVVRNASGQLFAVEDEAFATPLTFRDLSGVAQTELRVGPYGVTDSFRIDDYPRVMWKSGPYVIDLWSPDAIRDAAVAAAAAAETALAQVEALSEGTTGATTANEALTLAQATADQLNAMSVVQNMGGVDRIWGRTAAQGMPTTAEGVLEGDYVLLDA